MRSRALPDGASATSLDFRPNEPRCPPESLRAGRARAPVGDVRTVHLRCVRHARVARRGETHRPVRRVGAPAGDLRTAGEGCRPGRVQRHQAMGRGRCPTPAVAFVEVARVQSRGDLGGDAAHADRERQGGRAGRGRARLRGRSPRNPSRDGGPADARQRARHPDRARQRHVPLVRATRPCRIGGRVRGGCDRPHRHLLRGRAGQGRRIARQGGSSGANRSPTRAALRRQRRERPRRRP